MPPAPIARSGKSLRTTDSPITYFIQKALENPQLISFAAGLVDQDSVPTKEFGEAVAAVLANPTTARAALQYGSTQGLPALREQVLQLVCQADGIDPAAVNLTAHDVVITTGSQQLLYLLAELLLDPGDIVITEAPSYFVYHSLLQSHGVRVLAVPMDEAGLDTDALELLLERLQRTGDLSRVKLIYTVDYFQNPTGLTLAAHRRPKLVELARRFSTNHRILILEDIAYRELRYSGDDIPSVKRFDPTNEFVVTTGTFSKSCSPGLKTGYALLPRDVLAPLLHLKSSHDFGSNNLVQYALTWLIASGAYQQNVEKLRGVYRHKRNVMQAALEREFRDRDDVTWTTPDGGLYFWLTFKGLETGPTGPLVAAGLETGVLYVPGEFAHVADETGLIPRNECRLCFGVASIDEIDEGIRRLRQAVDRVATCGPSNKRMVNAR
jgi:2-aminoadipate transaminase